MDEQKLQAMKPENRVKMAVAYLMRHQDEIPEGLSRFFDKLHKYEGSLKDIIGGLQQAEAAFMELQVQRQQTEGSINAVVGLVVEELTDESQVLEWCKKYELPLVSPHIAGGSPVVKAGPTSIAGASASMQPPPVAVPAAAVPAAPAQQP